MQTLIALISGIIFGIGLTISGMTDPVRVKAFLDVFGHWDPTLAFVMAGAILPMILAWAIQRRLARPLYTTTFTLPQPKPIDARLIIGSGLFGIGWGLTGLCPGPAVANLTIAPLSILPFLIAMIMGMFLHTIWTRRH